MPLNEDDLEGLEPRELLQLGIDLFNSGQHFESHEAWEAAWIPSEQPLRYFYQGLIQVAAAFVHLKRNEYPGTEKLLREALAKLERFRPDCLGVDVDCLIGECLLVWQRVRELGPKRLDEITHELLPRIVQVPVAKTQIARFHGEDVRWLAWDWFDPEVPTVVLLHTPGLVPDVWQPVACRLSPAYKVLAPELPGHGLTPTHGSLDNDLGVLDAWLHSIAPDALAVIEAGPGGLAMRLAGARGAAAVAVRDLSGAEELPRDDARWHRETWPGRWDRYRALEGLSPFASWRKDVLWTSVEHSTGRVDAVEPYESARAMTEESPVRVLSDAAAVARFAALAAREVAPRTIAASSLSQPEQAADRLMRLLGTLA